jgi:hypothetical protein
MSMAAAMTVEFTLLLPRRASGANVGVKVGVVVCSVPSSMTTSLRDLQ